MRQTTATLAGILFLTACGTNTGVIPLGNDTYKIFKQGSTGFVGSDKIKSDVTLEASKYCADKGKSLQVVSVIEGSPPYILGNFPKAEIQFRCADSKELQLTGMTTESAAPTTFGEVAVSSNVPNAEVSVDGRFMGNAPLASLRLPPGTHAFEVTSKGYAPWRRELTVVQGSSTRVMAQLEEMAKP
jgi:hypothetical protein